jgi:hypothetical protein
MPTKYFENFPRVDYDIEQNKRPKTVIDILRRVGIRGDFVKLLPTYYKQVILNEERPDMLSFDHYGNTYYHWVEMFLNGVVDPYYDWIIKHQDLEQFINKKYPDRTSLLHTNHFTTSSYSNKGVDYTGTLGDADYLVNSSDSLIIGETYTLYQFADGNFTNVGATGSEGLGDTFVATGTTPTSWGSQILVHNIDDSGTRFFVEGENLVEYKSTGNTGTTGAVGKVDKFDASDIKLVHSSTGTSFLSDGSSDKIFLKGSDSGAVARLLSGVRERDGVHHYENSDGIEVGRTASGATAVTNAEYELKNNDSKREILVLRERYLNQFENELKGILKSAN